MNVVRQVASRILAASLLSLLSVSCDISITGNLPANDAGGLTLTVITNKHEADSSAEVAAAVYQDGIPIELTGGDLFRVTSSDEITYLKRPASLISGYAGSIETTDGATLDIEIIHDAVIAREDRWYPVDLFLIDPGPGPLVGRSASASFPDPVQITAPQDNTEYTSIGEQVNIEWIAGSGAESMQLLGTVECNDGLSTSRYGIQRTLNDDDGFESLPLDEVIFDKDTDRFNTFIGDLALVLLQELLNKLSAGNIDPDYVVKKIEANPIVSRCEIRLVVQRVRKGEFDAGFDGGDISASSSAEVMIVYNPPVLF